MKKPLCIYHGNCADGFGAAWVFKNYADREHDFHAGVYQAPPPDCADRAAKRLKSMTPIADVDAADMPVGCAIFPAGSFDEYPLERGAVGTSTEEPPNVKLDGNMNRKRTADDCREGCAREEREISIRRAPLSLARMRGGSSSGDVGLQETLVQSSTGVA